MDDLFPDLQQQLNKLTVIRYDSIQSTNAQRDEKLCQREHTYSRTKVSSVLQSLRQHAERG